ncbi:MAG: ADP-ribosyl-[dinitrogen reductase] hydrolase [Candidatus Thiodiazotropha endolucinida]|nr:ADP-ribosyl-[dinitrogen reductase] hydrolase [Candidatus Thiodiazotropha endolucinida]
MQDSGLSLVDRAVGAYLGLAVGDALGATTEFLTPREIREQYGVHRKICGGGWLHLKAGQVTDDTEMSLALGQSILDSYGVEAEAVAEAFSEWMRGKPVDIGNTVRRGIVHYRTTGVPRVDENGYDAGNGACMRCLPVALAYWNAPDDALIEASRVQSHVTHNAPIADAGTEAVLQMLVAAFKGEPKAVMREIAENLVECHKSYRFHKRTVENPSGWIVETLKAVFQAFFTHDSFEDILVDVVNRGGDADTTGAIAGMLAGACYGSATIPKQWLMSLNRDVKNHCEEQAMQLLALAENAFNAN